MEWIDGGNGRGAYAVTLKVILEKCSLIGAAEQSMGISEREYG
jgi:hypothetical protein